MNAVEPAAGAPELARSLRLRHLSMISIGGIIGAGLFVGSSAAIAATGPAIVLSYALAGLLVFLVMRMLGEMAVAHPEIRSFTEHARRGLGPWAGFLAGWLYWYFWIIVVPIEAIAGANILQAWVPLPAWQLGIALMLVMTAVNLMSTRSYGEFEFWFASIKVIAIVVFIALAGAYALGLNPHHAPTFANLSAYGGFMPRGFATVLVGAVTVFFSLTGAEITTIAAAESNDPVRSVARLSTSVIVRILLFYIGSVFLIMAVVPWTQVVVGESPFTLALATMRYDWANLAITGVILTAVLSCLNSAFYVCSRVLFVLAEKGDAPLWLVQLNTRRVPSRSVWAGTIAGLLGVVAATWSPQRVFAFLVNASGALVVFIYMLIAAAQIRSRRQRELAGAPRPALAMWLYPWSSYAAIAAMLAILVSMALSPGHVAELYTSVAAIAACAAAYWLRSVRRRAAAGATQQVRGQQQ